MIFFLFSFLLVLVHMDLCTCARCTIPPTTRGSVSTPPSITPSLVLNEEELIRINVDKCIEKVKDAVLQDKVVTMKIVDRSQCTIRDPKDYSVYPAMINEFILKLCDTERYRFTIEQDAITIGYRRPFLGVTKKEIVEGYAVGIVAREIATKLSTMSCSLSVMTFRDSEEILYSIPNEIRIQESLVGPLIVKLRELGFNHVDILENCLLVLPLPKIEPPKPVVPENTDRVATPEELKYDTFVFCVHAIAQLATSPRSTETMNFFNSRLKFDARKRRAQPGLYLQMYDSVYKLMDSLGYGVMRRPDQDHIKIRRVDYPVFISIDKNDELSLITNHIYKNIGPSKCIRVYKMPITQCDEHIEGQLTIFNLALVCSTLHYDYIDFYIEEEEEEEDWDDDSKRKVYLCCYERHPV